MDAIPYRLLCAAVLLLTLVASAARAEDTWPSGTAESTSVEAEYDKRIRAASAIDGLGTDLFGDSVNLYSGALSFAATDVSVPGNFDLPVAVGRRFTVGGGASPFSHFGDWELDVPHLSGVFAGGGTNGNDSHGWINTAGDSTRFNRCSRFEAPPTAPGSTGNGGFFEPYEFWHGVYLSTPGGREEVLLRDANLSWQPTDGNAYPLVTTGRWMIRCLPTTASGEPGEAFLAVSPDGTQYRFDWMVQFPVALVIKNHSVNPAPPGGGGTQGSSGPYSLSRSEYWMLPTTITDRHGNTVTYTYDTGAGADRRRLLSIAGISTGEPAMSGKSRSIRLTSQGSRWPGGDYSEVAMLSVRSDHIERCFGAPLSSGEEEGLGPWLAIGGRLESGVTVELIEFQHQPVKGFALHVDSACDPEAALEEVLALLGIGHESLKWRKGASGS